MSRGGGRGRGRGKAPLEAALGLAPGEAAPPPILQPPPLFPHLERRPLDLKVSEVGEYLVTVKQEMNQHMVQSPFHLTPTDPTAVRIVRYSDKYRRNGEASKNGQLSWNISWSYFPTELRAGRNKKPKRKRSSKSLSSSAKSVKRKRVDKEVSSAGDGTKGSGGGEGDTDDDIPQPKRSRRKVTFDDEQEGKGEGEVVKKLESLEKVEQLSGESEQSAGEEENPEEVYNEEEEEEGTDYNLTYFDNGEDREEEPLEEGPVY